MRTGGSSAASQPLWMPGLGRCLASVGQPSLLRETFIALAIHRPLGRTAFHSGGSIIWLTLAARSSSEKGLVIIDMLAPRKPERMAAFSA
jgi:hypothetical protein